MSIRLMSQVWDLPLGDSQKLVLLALADNANDSGWCWPSIATLVGKCGRSERTVQSTIRELEKLDHLTRQEVLGKGCKYQIHPRNHCTPATIAPPQPLPPTPATIAPKPSRTTLGDKSPREGTRLSSDFEMPANWIEWAIQKKGWDRGEVADEVESFIDYWHAKTGRDASKLDWHATWRNWVRSSRRPHRDQAPTVPL